MSSPVTDYFVHPFGNPDLADGFGSMGYWEGGEWVERRRPHRGLDYPQPAGAPIAATAHGVVVRVAETPALGLVTVLEHHRPGGKPVVFSGYAHQSRQLVALDEVVRRGDRIGHVGATGTEAVGDHLHFTMSHYVEGVLGPEPTFNPALFIANNDRESLEAAAVRRKVVRARRGDSLWSIAERYGINLSTIKKLNPGIKPPAFVIHPGERVRVR